MEEEKVYLGKTLEEAVNNALLELALPREDVEITVLEEGKKKLFGSTKWKIKVAEKKSDGTRAAQFIDGLLKILGIEGESVVVSENEIVKIDIKTESSSRVIGKRGEVLDAFQYMAGAVANIGREEYIKVVVDCENYRSQREEALVALANKIMQKALETGKKVILEPMNRYERRIIHETLKSHEDEVKTVSEGKEPARYIVVIPNNAKPGDKPIRYGEKKERRHGRENRSSDRRERRSDKRGHGKDDKRRSEGRGGKPSGAKRGKKEIIFGTFLGNSGATHEGEPEKTEE